MCVCVCVRVCREEIENNRNKNDYYFLVFISFLICLLFICFRSRFACNFIGGDKETQQHIHTEKPLTRAIRPTSSFIFGATQTQLPNVLFCFRSRFAIFLLSLFISIFLKCEFQLLFFFIENGNDVVDFAVGSLCTERRGLTRKKILLIWFYFFNGIWKESKTEKWRKTTEKRPEKYISFSCLSLRTHHTHRWRTNRNVCLNLSTFCVRLNHIQRRLTELVFLLYYFGCDEWSAQQRCGRRRRRQPREKKKTT